MAQCDEYRNASWATLNSRDPDATKRSQSAQLGACERVITAIDCCQLCSDTLGCLAWTFVAPSAAVPYLPVDVHHQRCCLKLHVPRHRPYAAPGCVAGIMRSLPCGDRCLMPRHLRSSLTEDTDTPPRPRVGNASHFPWLLVHQARQRQMQGTPSTRVTSEPRKKRTARVAVCITGTTRSLIHPTVWRSIEHNVLGRAHGVRSADEAGLDVFAVLSTGPEDTPHAAAERAKTYTPHDDLLARSQWRDAFTWRSSKRTPAGGPWEDGRSHSELLARALTGLRVLGVRTRSQPANLSCGLPSTAQFTRWADCVELVEAYEKRAAVASHDANGAPSGVGHASDGAQGAHKQRRLRYDAILKVRTDAVHKYPIVAGGSLSEMVAKLEPRTVVSADDLILLILRQQWPVLHAMRPAAGGVHCAPQCNLRFRAHFPDMDGYAMPTHCLMRSHFARFGVHLVDVGLMLPPEALLVDTALRAASPSETIGRLTPPSQILRLRPTRDVEREANLALAYDREGSERPIICVPIEPPAEHSCAWYLATFQCSPCGSADVPCPPLHDAFAPGVRRRGRAVVDAPPALKCLNMTCTSPGCLALADVVPADSAGNPFAARGRSTALGALGVQERTGRTITCARVQRALCEAGVRVGGCVPRYKRRGVVDNKLRASTIAADLDLDLIAEACALDAASNSSGRDGATAPRPSAVAHTLAKMEKRLHGTHAPDSMRSSNFFNPDDRRGWSAYFVMQLFEGEIVCRLLKQPL